MKNFILITMALASIASVGIVNAEETAQQPTPEDRTFELFQQYMQAKDRQMAEVIAYGALGKFGAEHPLIQKMRREVVKSAEGNVYISRRFAFLPGPSYAHQHNHKMVNSVYRLDELVAPIDNTVSERLEKFCEEMKALRSDDLEEVAIAVEPWPSNLSIVVSTTKEHHERIAEYLKTKRETK